MPDFATILVDLLQQRDISTQRAALGRLRKQLRAEARQSKRADEQMVELWAEVLDLRLYLAAALRLLVEKGVVSANELRAAVDLVDASDGESDGVFRGEVLPPGGDRMT